MNCVFSSLAIGALFVGFFLSPADSEKGSFWLLGAAAVLALLTIATK